MKQKIIQQGAEAIIYKQGNNVLKNRIKKSYRISELDNKIRKQRTKSEAKLLEKASSVINCPKPFLIVEDIFYQIGMPFIDGKKLSQYLNEFPLAKQKQILKQIGQDVAKLHNQDIIHGDLTTSNMILIERLPVHSRSQINNKIDNKPIESSSINRTSSPIIYFIDFGLGYISKKIEDKAVDIHLLRQALESKHFEHWEILFKEFEKGYSTSKDYKEVIERLKKVEARGRYKF